MSITDNRKAFFNYEIVEKLEAGIVLEGNEVKSIRKGKVNISEAFIIVKGNEIFVHNMHVEAYDKSSSFAAEPTRIRKLLLHKPEIARFYGKSKEKGLAIIPLSLFFKKDKVKLSIGLGKGKKLFDKRDSIKKKEQDRELSRIVKNNR